LDLLTIVRKIWRYKLATIPVLVFTLLGAFYAVALKQPTYEAHASYLLISPPPPPTEAQVAQNPALGRVNADNPYTRYTDQSVIVQILASALTNESARQALVKEGAGDRYVVAPGASLGYSTPIVDITGVGSTPQAAITSAEVVGKAAVDELERMQVAENVDSKYQIRTQQVDHPDSATLQASGQLRTLIAVLALGAILLFVVVSAADALATLRAERRGKAKASAMAADGVVPLDRGDARSARAEPEAANGHAANGDSSADADLWVPARRPAARTRSWHRGRGSGGSE
jgi:hypothetical protein